MPLFVYIQYRKIRFSSMTPCSFIVILIGTIIVHMASKFNGNTDFTVPKNKKNKKIDRKRSYKRANETTHTQMYLRRVIEINIRSIEGKRTGEREHEKAHLFKHTKFKEALKVPFDNQQNNT